MYRGRWLVRRYVLRLLLLLSLVYGREVAQLISAHRRGVRLRLSESREPSYLLLMLLLIALVFLLLAQLVLLLAQLFLLALLLTQLARQHL